jgi:hypothetical protein
MPVSFRVRRRDLIWSGVVIVLALLLVASDHRADAGLPSASGIDVVFVAVASNFPDALGVGPAAAASNAPILLVPTNPPIPADIEAELIRLDPKKVIIVGGTAVVSQAMEDAISDLLPATEFERLAGSNRFGTNAAVSESVFPVEGWAVVPAAAFSAPVSTETVVILDLDSLQVINIDGGALFAPIHLPDGAEILEVHARVFDIKDDGEVTVALRRSGVSVTQPMASISSGVPFDDGYTNLVDTSLVFGTERVDNEEWSYYIDVSGSDSSLQGLNDVRVKYRLGTAP